jgi:hypothetical protein
MLQNNTILRFAILAALCLSTTVGMVSATEKELSKTSKPQKTGPTPAETGY